VNAHSLQLHCAGLPLMRHFSLKLGCYYCTPVDSGVRRLPRWTYGQESFEGDTDTEGLYEKATEEGSPEEAKREADNEYRRKEGSAKNTHRRAA
jgi:hypothetical protein